MNYLLLKDRYYIIFIFYFLFLRIYVSLGLYLINEFSEAVQPFLHGSSSGFSRFPGPPLPADPFASLPIAPQEEENPNEPSSSIGSLTSSDMRFLSEVCQGQERQKDGEQALDSSDRLVLNTVLNAFHKMELRSPIYELKTDVRRSNRSPSFLNSLL